ncbi:hypothetical protein DVJ98_09545 [Staphylococcus aureus]|nr:hypothetical protein [Staphylococcus aureus]
MHFFYIQNQKIGQMKIFPSVRFIIEPRISLFFYINFKVLKTFPRYSSLRKVFILVKLIINLLHSNIYLFLTTKLSLHEIR